MHVNIGVLCTAIKELCFPCIRSANPNDAGLRCQPLRGRRTSVPVQPVRLGKTLTQNKTGWGCGWRCSACLACARPSLSPRVAKSKSNKPILRREGSG